MKGLLLVERFVLETLSLGSMDFEQIHWHTKLEKPMLQSILQHLSKMNLIELNFPEYKLTENCGMILKEISQNSESIQSELKEILNSWPKSGPDTNLSDICRPMQLKKVWVSSYDAHIIKAHLYNVEQYINSLWADQKKNPIDQPIHLKKLFLWGQCNYSDLVDSNLKKIS